MAAATSALPERLLGIEPVAPVLNLPIANGSTTIHGTLVALNASGKIVPLTGDPTLVAAGLEDGPGAAGNAAGSVMACVRQFTGYFLNSAIAACSQANVGHVVYGENNQTVSATSQGGTLPVLGVLVGFDTTGPIVEVSISKTALALAATPTASAVAPVGGAGIPFAITKVLADSAGGATTNVAIPQKCELIGLMIIKDGVTSASSSDTVQIKNHTGPTTITSAIPLNVAANTFVPLTGVTFQNTVLLAADSIDLVQAAHVTDNGCTVIMTFLPRA